MDPYISKSSYFPNTPTSMPSPGANYFQDWIMNTYNPNLIVYSSEGARKIISKNNLTPSEFFRPFGLFNGTNINFSFGEKFTINIKNFRLNFFDNDNFFKAPSNILNDLVENLLTYHRNYPNWNVNSMSTNNFDLIFRKLKNFSFPWFSEYEKLIFESLFFNEFDLYQQPFGHIYVISSKEDKKDLEQLLNKRNIPLLIDEGLYEKNMPSMIVILNDKSSPHETVSNESLFRTIDSIQKSFSSAFVYYSDINSGKNNEECNEDIWSTYLHKIDVYRSEKASYRSDDCKFGEYVSQEERENLKTGIFKFFNDYVKLYLQKLIVELDEEITNNKKGLKNGFLSIFKKSDKIEYVNIYNIYKLTTMERKLNLLSMIQFYFRDYENAMENLKILMSDVKSKSIDHYNSFLELYTICHFICATGNKKEVDMDQPYNSYLKVKNTRAAFRFLLTQIKMLEQCKRYSEVSKILIKATIDISSPYLSPLLLEKSSIYYLLSKNGVKKFIFFQILAGIAYKSLGTSSEVKRYSLNCFGNVIKYFTRNSISFMRTKEYLNSSMGDICMNTEYFEAAIKFFKNCIELSTYKNVDQDQALYIRHFLKSLNSQGQGMGLNYVEINSLNIPEIDNSSLSVIEDQDYEISTCKVIEGNNYYTILGWRNFTKYSKADLGKSYLTLSEVDETILQNFDNIVENKQNFMLTNSRKKRNMKIKTGKKVYVKFLIKNPLNLNLSVSSLKLVYDFQCDKNIEQQPDQVIQPEIEEKSILLEKNSSLTVTLVITPRSAGLIEIKGLEIGLYKIALFRHSFSKVNCSDLYKNLDKKRKSLKTENLNTQNNHNKPKANKREIVYEVIDEKQDVQVIFPMGREFNMFLNEFKLMPIVIKNEGALKIKRECIYFEDMHYDPLTKIKSENQLSLLPYINMQKDLFKDKTLDIVVPICALKLGENFLKIICKFEEELKFKEIDIKRFIIKVNVIPSVKFNINEDTLLFDSISSHLFLDVSSFIENKERLTAFKIEELFYNETFIRLPSKYSDWRSISNEKYEKLYAKFEFKKLQKSRLNNPHSIDQIKDIDISNIDYVNRSMRNILLSDKIIFKWRAQLKDLVNTTDDNQVQGFFIYDLKNKTPSISKNFLKTVLKNSIQLISSQKSFGEQTLVQFELKINHKNLRAITEISSFEFFINEDDLEHTWMGLSRFKLNNLEKHEKSDQDEFLCIIFTMLTDKKGLIEISKFSVTVHPKNLSEKPFNIHNVPSTITLEIK